MLCHHKTWKRITILGAFGVTFEIQRAKFGVFGTYIFGGKIWGSDTKFRGKFWGQALRPPYMEVSFSPCMMRVQYNVCSVHREMFSASGVFSTSGGYHEYIGGYHEYVRGCSVHWGDIMMHVGEQVGENLSISI